MTLYRDSIDMQDKYRFGIELEFKNALLNELSKLFQTRSLPVEFIRNHKNINPTYKNWYLDTDATVTEKDGNQEIGGELSSRIFIDEKNTWQEIKTILETLKEAKARINDRCSNHIRVELTSLNNDANFFEIFSKLIAILEYDINLFYMGDTYLKRETAASYAGPLKPYLFSYINRVDFNDPNFYYEFRRSSYGLLLFTTHDAINLNDYLTKKLVEIRYPNGTLNPKTVQNNINFTLKLINAIASSLFDAKELSKILERLIHSKDFVKFLIGIPNPKGFEQLVETISTSSEDVNDFMTQYEKVLSMKKAC